MQMQVSESYIKQSYSLAWRFYSQNKMASFIVIGVSFALVLLSMIPLLGFFMAVGLGMVFLAVQTYMAKAIMHADNDDEYDQIISNTKPAEMIMQYLSVGAGAYLGFFLIEVVLLIAILSTVFMSLGMDTLTALSNGTMPAEEQMELYQSAGTFGLVFIVAMMFFAYIYPLVLGRVYRSESFAEAFRNMFLLFSPRVWTASFNVRYFLLVTMLHLTLIGTMLLFAVFVIAASALISAFMMVILVPLTVFVGYILILYATSIAVMGNYVSFDDEPLAE